MTIPIMYLKSSLQFGEIFKDVFALKVAHVELYSTVKHQELTTGSVLPYVIKFLMIIMLQIPI